MSLFKNISREKAYIGDIKHGYANLILCNTYSNSQEISKKMMASKVHKQSVIVKLCHEEKHIRKNVKASYIVIIEGIPINDIRLLPDWKDTK